MTSNRRTMKVCVAAALSAASVLGVATSARAAGWTQTSGCANAVANGWVIGCGTEGQFGWPIYQWTGSGWAQRGGGAAAVQISTDQTESPWVVNAAHDIFYYDGGSFRLFDDAKPWKTVAVADPTRPYNIWATDTNLGIWVYTGTQSTGGVWKQLPGAADKITVLPFTESCTQGSVPVPRVIHNGVLYQYEVSGSCELGGFVSVTTPVPVVDISSLLVLGNDGITYDWAIVWVKLAPTLGPGAFGVAESLDRSTLFGLGLFGNIFMFQE